MQRRLLLAFVLLGPALAGCIGDTGDQPLDPVDTEDAARRALEDPMAALDAGNTSANLELLGQWGQGGAEEVDPWEDHLFVDRGNTVHILNVSDPRNPEEVSQIAGAASVVDVKVSDDGDYLFLGDDTEASGDPIGGTGPLTGGIYVYDVSDKTDPVQVTYEPVGHNRGPHMVFYHDAARGGEYVYAAAGNAVVIHEFIRSEGTLQEIARYQPGQLAQDRDPQRVGPLYNPQAWLHDMFVMEEDEQTLMYVAAWDAGLHVVDVTDPTAPEQVGAWSDFGEGEAGNLHTVATDWVGDRRITVGAVEVGFAVVGGTLYATGEEKSVTYVWDTTDPSQPELLGTWTNPIQPSSGRDMVPGEEVTSTHNLQIENGRIYLAHYEYGVWILDVSTPENRSSPEILAYYDDGNMHTWDVVLEDGVVYTSGRVGVQGLAFPLDPIGPDGVTSRA